MSETVNIHGAFEAAALSILRAIPDLRVTVDAGRGDHRADAILHFGRGRARVAVEVKQRANAATAWHLVHVAKDRPGTPLLLIAAETTVEAREILAKHGIGVLDSLGNAHIKLPGLMFHLEGKKPAPRIHPTRLNGKAGVAVQALLLHPARAWNVKQLALEAHLSPSLAHRVLARLEKEKVVAAEGAGPNRTRRVLNPTALIDLWAEENSERPVRILGHLLAQSPQKLMTSLGNALERNGTDYAFTGAAGASLVAPFVTALPVVEVWVASTASPEALYEVTEAKPVTSGHNLVFLQARNDTPLAFREKTNGLWVANRFRLYADLRNDPRRGREQADNLRREAIGF